MALTLVGVCALPATSAPTTSTRLKASLSLNLTRALVGQSIVADIHKSRLPKGTKLKTATIKWGDGRKTTVRSLKTKPTHHYSHAGSYKVTATVTDNKHKSAHASRTEKVIAQTVYWTLFDGQSQSYQLESARLALTSTSHDVEISGTPNNQLQCTAGMAVGPSGRLWVLTYPSGCSAPNPASIAVFTPPINQSSTPVMTFTLPGAGDVDHITFDHAGNLWASDYYNNAVYEFTGPFKSSGPLSAAVTLTNGLNTPSGVAVDAKGNVFVPNIKSTGTKSIAVFHAPVSDTTTPTFLNGLANPGGVTVDAKGNLYASSNSDTGPGNAIVRYNKGHMANHATPSVVDRSGPTKDQYEADFAWDAVGDLYDADCGSHASIRVYPLATKAFKSSLKPSVVYTNASLKSVGCAWGVAIH
jgi:hypothetical protein